MSFLSEIGKRLGLREWSLKRDGKAAANALLRQYTQQAAGALEQLGDTSSDMQDTSQEAVLREAHRAVEKLGIPFYVLALVGPQVDQMILSQWSALSAPEAIRRELYRIARQVRGARL